MLVSPVWVRMLPWNLRMSACSWSLLLSSLPALFITEGLWAAGGGGGLKGRGWRGEDKL